MGEDLRFGDVYAPVARLTGVGGSKDAELELSGLVWGIDAVTVL